MDPGALAMSDFTAVHHRTMTRPQLWQVAVLQAADAAVSPVAVLLQSPPDSTVVLDAVVALACGGWANQAHSAASSEGKCVESLHLASCVQPLLGWSRYYLHATSHPGSAPLLVLFTLGLQAVRICSCASLNEWRPIHFQLTHVHPAP